MKETVKELPKLSHSTQFIDTHCHLDMAAYTNDLEDVLTKAFTHHIQRIISIGVDLASSQNAITLAHNHEQISSTIGIHPHDVDNLKNSVYTKLEQLYLEHSKHIVGFGEIGLDYAKQYSVPSKQREHFKRQLDLAHALKLPVVIHNRDANDDTINILRKAKKLDYGGIMHCFSGDITFAREVLDLGLLISIPGIVTFKNAKTLHQVAREIPLTSMVLETDGPFLAPHPFRGKRNEPSYLLFTAQKIAELREIKIEQVSMQTTANATDLFKFNRI